MGFPWSFVPLFFPSEGTIDGNPHISIHHIDHSTMNHYCRSCANIVHHIYFHYESLSTYFWNPQGIPYVIWIHMAPEFMVLNRSTRSAKDLTRQGWQRGLVLRLRLPSAGHDRSTLRDHVALQVREVPSERRWAIKISFHPQRSKWRFVKGNII